MMIWYQNKVSHAFAFGSAYHPADDNDKQLGQLPIANEPWVNSQQDVFMPAVDVELGEMIIHTNHIWSSWSGKKLKDAHLN